MEDKIWTWECGSDSWEAEDDINREEQLKDDGIVVLGNQIDVDKTAGDRTRTGEGRCTLGKKAGKAEMEVEEMRREETVQRSVRKPVTKGQGKAAWWELGFHKMSTMSKTKFKGTRSKAKAGAKMKLGGLDNSDSKQQKLTQMGLENFVMKTKESNQRYTQGNRQYKAGPINLDGENE